MKNKLTLVYMPSVAAKLRNMGFSIVKITANTKKPQYDVYWFEDTPNFRQALNSIINKKPA